MPVVTNTIKRPDGTAATDAIVLVQLVGDNARPVNGYVSASDYSIHGTYRPAVNSTTAVWSMTLVANSLISPAGTRWKVTENVDGVSSTYYLSVPDGAGPYFVEDILDEAPGSIASSALTTHLNDTVDAHDASAVSFAGAVLSGATVQAALDEVAVAPYAAAVRGSTGAAIQAALDGLGAWSVGDALRRVAVYAGDYTTSAAITVPSGVHLDLTGGVTITLANGSNCDIFTNSDWVNGNSDITIEGGFLDGNRANQANDPGVGSGPGQSLISFVNVTRPKALNVRGKSAFLHGVDFSVRDPQGNPDSDPGCVDFLAEGCEFSDCGDDEITAHYSSGVVRSGFQRDAGKSYTVTNSNGVEIDDGCHDVLVDGVTVDNCGNGLKAQGHEDRQGAYDVLFSNFRVRVCDIGLSANKSGEDGDGNFPGRNVRFADGLVKDCPIGFQTINYKDVELQGVTFDGCTTALIEFLAGYTAARTTGIRLRNCTIKKSAINLGNYATLGVTLDNCTIYEMGVKRLSGTVYASTPDAAGHQITGDLQLGFSGYLSNWAGGSTQTMISKWGSAGNEEYYLRLNGAGTLTMAWHNAGGILQAATSTAAVGFAAGDGMVRATLDVDDGAGNRVVTFEKSTDGGASWSNIGTPVTTAGTTSVRDTASDLQVGVLNTATNPWLGTIYRGWVKNAGSYVADCNLEDVYVTGDQTPATYTDPQSNAWTINGGASTWRWTRR